LARRCRVGLELQGLKAEVFVALRTVKLAYFVQIERLNTEDTERHPISILLQECLLHALLFSTVRLEALTVVRVRKQDLGKRNCQEVLVHSADI